MISNQAGQNTRGKKMDPIKTKQNHLREILLNELSDQIRIRAEVQNKLSNLNKFIDIAKKWAQTEMIFNCLRNSDPTLSITYLSGDIVDAPKLYNEIADLVLNGEPVRDAWKMAEANLS